MAVLTYFGSYLGMPKDFGQCYTKIFDIAKNKGQHMLLQNFKAIGSDSSYEDPLIFEKCH